ncbi:MAG: bifunctional folylpolyglutamate synthase/dihydrofolate synthase [Candidatus Eisenbacteria bacterium]|nr:bifunctional folylpolyglutamate synthase/dihydrofolate synthase [Candidatus Eisenbacteria bacterium]
MTRRANKVFDTYRSCLGWLFARHRFTMKPGLDRVVKLLAAVGDPHERFRVVHVGGTNGKGSTACMIASMLAEHDMKVGLYMSPHVVDFTERISVCGRGIEQAQVVDYVERLKPAADEIEATFFEIVTAVAALHFAAEGVDLAVAEVGLGGRLDATNALDSVVSVITGIGVDHAEILGSDIPSIAAEKAGIIREGGVAVVGASGAALDVIRGVVAARKARLVPVGPDSVGGRISLTPSGSFFDFSHGEHGLEGVSISMIGRHQVRNATTALVTLYELAEDGIFEPDERAIRRGLAEASCVGRMQIIDRRPTLIADVAHNPNGAAALADALAEVFVPERTVAVLGIMGDKDIRGFLAALSDVVDALIVTRPSTDRAADPAHVAETARELGIDATVVETPGAAVRHALSTAGEADLVLITGSHYTVGDVMQSLGVGHSVETG